MSLIKVRKIATLDSEAGDIQLPFIITFNNGKKEFREGYSAEEVRRRFDKGVAALYGGIKSVKLESEDKRDGKDSIAADAKDSARNVKYRGCEITVAYHNPDNVNLSGKTWIVKDVDGVSVGGFSSEAKAKAWIDAHPSRTADSRAADAKFKVGDKVRRGMQTGIVRGIEKAPYIEVKFTDEPVTVFVRESEIVAADSHAADACGKGEDAKNDFANRIMPLVRRIADAQKVIEGVLSEAEELGYEAAHGEFPDSTFAKKSANQLEAACYEAVTALRKVKTIAVL